MPKQTKTESEHLVDAQNIIRQKLEEINSLKKTVAQIRRDNDTAEAIRQEYYGLSGRPPEPPTWLSGRGVSNGHRGGPITVWSDFHYGEVIDPDQINGANKFNKDIAKVRFQRLVDTTISLCTEHMGRANVDYPGIVICLGGDMVGGDIHEELAWTNDRTSHQAVHELTDMLASGIEEMARSFGHVFVTGVVGNHGRSTKKLPNKNRVLTSYDWLIYLNLERYFRNDKRVKFMIPSGPDARFTVYGHRYLLTHGDSMGVKGGDGIIGAIGPITRGIMKLHASQASLGQAFDTAIIGHWHQYITLPGGVVNNALKGIDEYALMSLRAKVARPSQALWFTHPEHGITAHWQVYLEGQEPAALSQEWISWNP